MKQLNDGTISVWKHDAIITEKPAFHQFIIKISGVWENEDETGLTYKFIWNIISSYPSVIKYLRIISFFAMQNNDILPINILIIGP